MCSVELVCSRFVQPLQQGMLSPRIRAILVSTYMAVRCVRLAQLTNKYVLVGSAPGKSAVEDIFNCSDVDNHVCECGNMSE